MTSPWIQTHKGIHFDLADPQPEMIDIEDIAYALARIIRFNGHGALYSVAQHSVVVSFRVPFDLAFEGLMHDAHEAYMGDVSAPLKRFLPGLQIYEAFLASRVRQKFGLPTCSSTEVKLADLEALLLEKKFSFADELDWELGPLAVRPLVNEDSVKICLESAEAEALFLDRFWQIEKRGGR